MTDEASHRLAKHCEDTMRAAQDALTWFRTYPDTVAAQRPVLEKDFRMHAVTARKLAAAAKRPMAVGVYGLSQAGKSYLISTLARPQGGELTAELDRNRGFLADINPESEKEATGLVTRFTMRKEKGPEGFPVRLRLLTETDLVKILANSWYYDALDATKSCLPDAAIEKVLEAGEKEAGSGRELGEVAQEDIWDLQNYVEQEFRGFPSARMFNGAFWDRIAPTLTRLPLERRIELYALLWHGFVPFTDVLRRLLGRLRELQFKRDVWAPIAALVPKTDSVLRVDTLDHLAEIEGPRLDIQAQGGPRCTLTRAELTALVAELQITMAELPWPIFESTDLLDFPGARERTGKDHQQEIAARPVMLGEFFLRGKVAYLFERYAAERELNALLLCIKESNNAFDKTIRLSIRNWIARTHGELPEERERVETALFVVLTRMDMHFNRTPGRDDDASSSDLWEARVKSSLEQPLQEANGWLDAWHTRRPFNNILLARNPGRSQSLSRLASDGTEAGFLPGIPDRIERWGAEFASHPQIQRYVRDAKRAWDEVFRLNDAGMSYIVERLAPVCRPELKQRQVENQLGILQDAMKRRLREWYVSDDLEAERKKRLEAIQPALDAMAANFQAGRFGLLLTLFHLDAAEARQVLLRTGQAAGNGAAAPAASVGRVGDLRSMLTAAAKGKGAPAAASAARDPLQERAAAVIAAWIGKMRRFAAEPITRGYFSLDAPAAEALVAEIAATAMRCGLQARVLAAMQRVKGGLRFDQVAERRAEAVSQIINEQVNFVGLSIGGVLAPDRPVIEGWSAVFTPPPPPTRRFELEDEPEPYGALFCLGWVDSLADAVDRNVRSRGDGQLVDKKQNEALGAVLALL